ncbi:hypothetical protein Zmor_021441 [Zophobas morio]|uniref:Uncharacterized protein n=1 Tax=Zophobas morio TaxID=2755281 RepID=A0AA38MB33_9CUCU|nr:hypothetical protein Zmor_021441 [Zophobas morio]
MSFFAAALPYRVAARFRYRAIASRTKRSPFRGKPPPRSLELLCLVVFACFFNCKLFDFATKLYFRNVSGLRVTPVLAPSPEKELASEHTAPELRRHPRDVRVTISLKPTRRVSFSAALVGPGRSAEVRHTLHTISTSSPSEFRGKRHFYA